MNSISFFHIGFVICLAGAILFFVISAILFFVFDIRTIFSIRSGRAQAKTVKEMEMVNSSTGRLRAGKKNTTRESSQKKGTKKQERRAPAIQPPVIQPPSADYAAGQAQDSAADYEEGVTEKLVPGGGSEETSLLSEAGETEVLNPAGETEVLNPAGNIAASPAVQAAETPAPQSSGPVYFEIVKKIICLDTDEVIN